MQHNDIRVLDKLDEVPVLEKRLAAAVPWRGGRPMLDDEFGTFLALASIQRSTHPTSRSKGWWSDPTVTTSRSALT